MLKKIGLSLLTSLLLALPWLGAGGWWAVIAFVPLLILQSEREKKFGWWVALSLFGWIMLSAWWVSVSTIIALFAVPIVGLFFSWTPFMIYHYVWKRAKGHLAWVVLVTAWISFEALYTYQDISFPWLNLGNAFAETVWAVQWYEYTGTFGGTLWILVANILAFNLWQERKSLKRRAALLIWVGVPTVFSLVRYVTYQEKENPIQVCVVQPNVDPYTNRMYRDDLAAMTELLLTLSSEAPKNVDFIVTPESALTGFFKEANLPQYQVINIFQEFLRRNYPKATFVFGATTLDEKEHYNSAIWVDSSAAVDVYHKSKLVIGTEMIPYPEVFEFLRIDNISDYCGNYGTQAERAVFKRTGAAICYESVYGAYFTEYIDKGAQLMFVITNDAWWGDTRGYHQHLSYSRLRAVETRRSIARSANTGISAIINQRGDVVDELGWDKRGVINGTVNLNDEKTFYVEYKDIIARLSVFILALSLLYFAAMLVKRKQ